MGHEDDLYNPAKDYAPRLCELGTAGWSSSDDVADLGSTDNDGLTFVKVTLYAGRDPGEPIAKGVAQGREILAVLGDGMFRIPKKGARCYVLFPSGMELVPGAGVIVATVSVGGETRKNVGGGDTIVSATGGGAACFLVKKDGSIVLFTTDSNALDGNPVAFRISPQGGLEFSSQWGSLVLDQTGFHVRTQMGPRLDMGGIDIPGVPSAAAGAFTGYATLTAPNVQLSGANVILGMGPVFGQAVQGNPALLVGGGPVPLGLADIAASAIFGSNTVWISI